MQKIKWIRLNRSCIQRLRIKLYACEKEMLFKQNARIQWLSLGDQNTSYFHKSVNGRQNQNKLLSVTREDGEVVEGHEVVIPSPMMWFIFGHAKDLSFRIFPQAQEQQLPGALIVQKFLPRKRLDLIQVDQIEPSESLHKFQMCFNKAKIGRAHV